MIVYVYVVKVTSVGGVGGGVVVGTAGIETLAVAYKDDQSLSL